MIKITVPWMFPVEDPDIEIRLEKHIKKHLDEEGITITRLVHVVDDKMEVHFETEEDRLAYVLSHDI